MLGVGVRHARNHCHEVRDTEIEHVFLVWLTAVLQVSRHCDRFWWYVLLFVQQVVVATVKTSVMVKNVVVIQLLLRSVKQSHGGSDMHGLPVRQQRCKAMEIRLRAWAEVEI